MPALGVGGPDGHGRYGILDDDGDRALCHDCGGWYASIAAHARAAHGITAADYREAHGLGRRTSLSGPTLRAARSARARAQIGTPAWDRLVTARDPLAASAARDPDTYRTARPQVAALRTEQAAAMGRATRRPRVRTCPECGARWCPLPGGYRRRLCGRAACALAIARRSGPMAQPPRRTLTATEAHDLQTTSDPWPLAARLVASGVTQAEIARTLGLSPATTSRALAALR